MRVHADAAHPAQLEEREDDVVVAGVEVEARLLDDEARLMEIVVRLLHGRTFSISASLAIVSGSMLMTTRPGML